MWRVASHSERKFAFLALLLSMVRWREYTNFRRKVLTISSRCFNAIVEPVVLIGNATGDAT